MTQTQTPSQIKDRLLDAALPHVAFDGWAPDAFDAAIAETGIAPAVARAMCPRGAVDLAVAFHRRGDDTMVARLAATDMQGVRFRDRIALAVRERLIAVADDKEAVRRGSTLFALPHLAGDGAKLIWGTADRIWTALGDTSEDFNWYSKRATLSGVYGATVLFWLGDDSPDHAQTWDFLDRRIDNVMQIEAVKKTVRDSPTLSAMMAGPNWLLGQIKAPARDAKASMPGSWGASAATPSPATPTDT